MTDTAAPRQRCPRCGGDFHCGANDAGPCACTTICLDAASLAALRAQFSGCLCLRCLAAIARGAPASTPNTRHTEPAAR